MKNIITSGQLASATALACALVLSAPTHVSAQVFSPNACERTAGAMQQSCQFETYEELLARYAFCQGNRDDSGRMECRLAAIDTWSEERETCSAQREARLDACDALEEDFYDDPLASSEISFIDPDTIGESEVENPYFPMAVGHTYVLRAGEEGEELVVVHVTNQTREILGVDCRIVADVVFEVGEDEEDGEIDYTLVEYTDDWYAQDTAANVYYCGELSRNYEDGLLNNIDGSFEAGKDGARAGILLHSLPSPGEAHRQEYALAEAEDIVQYLEPVAFPSEEEGGENTAFSCAANGGCLKTFDSTPIDPESTEFKYYIPGVGFVLAVAFEDGELTGEREVLQCTGDSLDLLFDPACGIEDPAELFEELCETAPDFFCDDGDED